MIGVFARAFLIGVFLVGIYGMGCILEKAFDTIKRRQEQADLIALMSIERPKAPQWFTLNSLSEHQIKPEVEEITVERNGKFITIVPAVKENA